MNRRTDGRTSRLSRGGRAAAVTMACLVALALVVGQGALALAQPSVAATAIGEQPGAADIVRVAATPRSTRWRQPGIRRAARVRTVLARRRAVRAIVRREREIAAARPEFSGYELRGVAAEERNL